jgi:soluble lytic murein transglycosylase-like protein
LAFNPKAESWVHAAGLMQAMPATWQWYIDMGIVPKGATPWEPQWSIVGGHWHMNYLEARTRSWNAALAAYNWGRLDRIRKAQTQAELLGFPSSEWHRFMKIPAETAGYVDRIPRVHKPWVQANLK